MHKLRTSINLAVVVVTLVTISGRLLPLHAQEDPDKFIAKVVEQMSPQAKVGQLFIVSFPGTGVGSNSDVARLISEYKVSGVVLSPASGNMVNDDNPPEQIAQLTASLQDLARVAEPDANGKTTPFVPLFVAMAYEYDFLPYSAFINGLTPLPSPLALGATWKPDHAYNTGKLAGKELAALGINVILGPSLDLLTDVSQAGPDGLQTFGGDSYWVGNLGWEFVRGLREGSNNRVTAALSHFPGQGVSGDSLLTIDKSLSQLERQDLLSFQYAMRLQSGVDRPMTDALMVTQRRYRGFSDNIRERTRPLVVDAQALQLVLGLTSIKTWRDASGVLFSDSLGSPTLRSYYDPQQINLPTPGVAQDAFLAGNDVLILSEFGGDDWPTQLNAITQTITSFQDKYSTDLTFQARVNDAVARILRLKYRLYPGFEAATVAVQPDAVNASVGLESALTQKVAQDALTRLWPPPGRAAGDVLSAIEAEDNLVILTDDRQVRDCPLCTPRPVIENDALARAITQRYSPGGRLDPARVTSLSFKDVQTWLETDQAEDKAGTGALLKAANWIILVIVDAQTEPTASLLRQLLVERPDLLGIGPGKEEGHKGVIALSFGVPYTLDKNHMNYLTTYYGLYGSSTPFIETAAQVLFGDLLAPGAAPISIPAIGYDLVKQLEPDPGQFIQIFIGEPPVSDATAQAVSLKVGDLLKLRTGVIRDRNGNPVPDDTPVTFTRIFSGSSGLPALTVKTHNGIANVEFTLDKIGPLRIRAFSEPALTSYELQVTVLEGSITIETVAPPTLTPSPLPPTLTPTPTPTPTPSPTPTPQPPWWQPLADPQAPRRLRSRDLLMALAGITLVSLTASLNAHRLTSTSSQAEGEQAAIRTLRWALGCAGAGLAGYILYGLGIPGTPLLDFLGSMWASLIFSMAFAALPLVIGLGWRQVRP